MYFIILIVLIVILILGLIFKQKYDRKKLSDDKNYIEPEIKDIKELDEN